MESSCRTKVPFPLNLVGNKHGSDRRVWVRFPTNLVATPVLGNLELGGGWEATVRDASVSGLGLIMDRFFENGTVLIMELQTPHEEPAQTAMLRVVHTQALPEGNWLVGCAFAD